MTTKQRVMVVVALAAAFALATSTAAFADHSPSFYVEWNQTSEFTGYATTFGNQGTGSPHQGYLEGTEVRRVPRRARAPVPFVKWDTGNDNNRATRTAVAGGQYYRLEYRRTARTRRCC